MTIRRKVITLYPMLHGRSRPGRSEEETDDDSRRQRARRSQNAVRDSVDHALFALAAMHVGVPSAAISPAYSLMSRDFDKLKGMIGLLEPGAIYVSGTKLFAAALAAIKPLHQARIVSGNADDADAIPF